MIEFELKRTGMLIVVSAPSGGGKSTIIRALLEADDSLDYSISATTRSPRADEEDGRDYHFLSIDQFRDLVDQEGFYEYAEVHGNFYGTPRRQVDEKLELGKDVILDIDVQGSMRLRKTVRDCTTIFILPPSMATLEKRLRGRASDSEETIQRRLENARGEVRLADQYDYILVNRELPETIANMQTIIQAQRFRASRMIVRDGFGTVLAPQA